MSLKNLKVKAQKGAFPKVKEEAKIIKLEVPRKECDTHYRIKEVSEDVDTTLLDTADEMTIDFSNKDDLIKASSPVFYVGESNSLENYPNPYTLVMHNLHHAVRALQNDSGYAEAMQNNPKIFENRIVPRLKSIIYDTVTIAYMNAIHSSVISFLQSKLSFLHRYYMDGSQGYAYPYTLDIINKCARSNDIGFQIESLTRCITEFSYLNSIGNMTIENFNSLICYHVSITRDAILGSIANDLNALVRTFSFGEPFLTTTYPYRTFEEVNDDRAKQLYGPGKKQRAMALQQLLCEFHPNIPDEINGIEDQEWYWILSCETRVELEVMSPMIEMFLWQIVAAIRSIFTPEFLKVVYKDYNKRWLQGMDDDEF
jgi:hypothetical protein